MASVQIPRGGPPRSLEVPTGKARSRDGSLYAVPGGTLHGLTDDELAVVQKTYPKARVIPAKKVQEQPSRDEPSEEKPAEPTTEKTDDKPKGKQQRPEPRRKP